MNMKSLQAQEARAKRNYSLRWKKYKAAIKETLLVEGQLVLVKPLIQPSPLLLSCLCKSLSDPSWYRFLHLGMGY